jgi:hypothetical protein
MVTSLAHQARIDMADLPRHVRGEIDLLREDLLPPELLSSTQSECMSLRLRRPRSRRPLKPCRG